MAEGIKKSQITMKSGRKISVAKKNYSKKGLRKAGVISDSDFEMDLRASDAVCMAIKKAKILRKPIAKYDRITGEAYLEYPDGRREKIDG
ncbi:MAG: hypothetical protein IJ121_06115 [Eubacterium sp.]|nr:hypothetical protein [Eubacterium sp.]